MLTIAETRRARLNLLLSKFGTLASLNTALSWARTDPKLSQIKNEHVRGTSGRPYNMGDAMAREIEQKLGLDHGWMDTPPSLAEQYGHEDPRTKTWNLMVRMPESQLQTAYRLISALAQDQPPQKPDAPPERRLLQPSDYVKAHAPKPEKPIKRTGNDAL